MIIWRGLGFLTVLFGLLGLLAGTGLSTSLAGGGSAEYGWTGVGLLVGGAASFALGWYLNVVRPKQKVETFRSQRGAELAHAVANGTFQPAPGIVPSSAQEAQQQADALLQEESAEVARRVRNVHTLFWIPMQWVGAVHAVLGLVLAVLLFTS